MSPEQVAGDRLDGRSDVYTLGVVLYESATGTSPVGGTTSAQVMANQLRQIPAALATAAPELPTALADVIMRALAKDPAARWASAREMADALRAASAPDRLITPRQASKRVRRRWYGRFGMVLGGLAVGIVLIVIMVVRTLRSAFSGELPAVDAFAPMIPPALLDSARTSGLLAQDDTALYLFARHGDGVSAALAVTSRGLNIARRGTITRYLRADDYDINLAWRGTQGFVTLKMPRTGRVDTLFTSISGVEEQALGLALKRLESDKTKAR
jgi:hypothetical protein